MNTLSTNDYAIVITSIAAPNRVIKMIAEHCAIEESKSFIVIGDTKSPTNFFQPNCDYYSIDRQLQTGFLLASLLPTRHYSRKNIGYLLAWQKGFEVMVETDDDNIPLPSFWQPRCVEVNSQIVRKKGWANIYKLFSDENIWPRGLPLERLKESNTISREGSNRSSYCPIQQGLANENPDVDAVYRMILPLPINFKDSPSVSLDYGVWCPFNSQNTTWFKEAFPLLYLPSFCSFRMTDIWRSFVAQRIAWTNDWQILFHNATVIQERNEHSLFKDFEDETSGYLLNDKIVQILEDLPLKKGIENIYDNLFNCYETMVKNNFITNKKELDLLEAWINDCKALNK